MDGFNIARARKAKKPVISQEKLAKQLHIYRTTLGDIERDAVEVTDAYIQRALGAIEQIEKARQEIAA